MMRLFHFGIGHQPILQHPAAYSARWQAHADPAWRFCPGSARGVTSGGPAAFPIYGPPCDGLPEGDN